MAKTDIFRSKAKKIKKFDFFEIHSESFKTYFKAKIRISKILPLQNFQVLRIF